MPHRDVKSPLQKSRVQNVHISRSTYPLFSCHCPQFFLASSTQAATAKRSLLTVELYMQELYIRTISGPLGPNSVLAHLNHTTRTAGYVADLCRM